MNAATQRMKQFGPVRDQPTTTHALGQNGKASLHYVERERFASVATVGDRGRTVATRDERTTGGLSAKVAGPPASGSFREICDGRYQREQARL